MRRNELGFTFVEAMIALVILLGVMAIAFTFFVDFGTAINTESSTLATQQSGRVVLDELTRTMRQIGYGTRRLDPYNPTTWQRGVIYGGSHVLAFNADIDGDIGGIPSSVNLSFPTGPLYYGEGIPNLSVGAETYVYTIDANGNGTIEAADRHQAESGSYNPAADTYNPLDFALIRRVYGYNGVDYGGDPEPLAASLFTNGTADISYPADGTTPAPLFTYWLTEDLNDDGILAPEECMNDVVDSCPPSSKREPRLYLWGDTDFDGTLSESEKAALRTLEVGSTGWSKNRMVESGFYKSTQLAAPIDAGSPSSYEIAITNGTKIGPGYHVRIGNGLKQESLLVDQVVTTKTPNLVLLATMPKYSWPAGTKVEVVPSTLLRAIRAVGVTYTTISDRKETEGGMLAAGRAGRKGTNGLDYRVAAFQRRVEVINAPTSAMADLASDSLICPLKIVNECSELPSEQSIRYANLTGQHDFKFLVTDHDGNPVPGVSVVFSHSKPAAGTLVEKVPRSNSSGMVTVGYAPSGNLGTDQISAKVNCLLDSGILYEETATNTLELYEVTTSTTSNCASTISDFTSAPSTNFTVQVSSESGGFNDQAVVFDLSVESPKAGDSALAAAELFLDGKSVGQTDGTGVLAAVDASTGADGVLDGTIVLTSDPAREGAVLKLKTGFSSPGCEGQIGSIEDTFGFFKLTLDSTVPGPGCTEYLPCEYKEGQPAPRVAAHLSLVGSNVPTAPVQFATQDVNPPTDGMETAASLLFPGSVVETNADGDANVIVANNGSKLITPETPLLTYVDASSTGPPNVCTGGNIPSSSVRAGFEFHDPTNLCGAEVQQAYVGKLGKDKLCLTVRNNAESDGCPLRVAGVQLTIYEANGLTPDVTDGSLVKKMEGGDVTASSACSDGNRVTLFDDDCRVPKSLLPNGDPWMFTDFSNCSLPFLEVPPENYFSISTIQFQDDYPPGRPMDVTVYYECLDDCDAGSVDAKTFKLTTPF